MSKFSCPVVVSVDGKCKNSVIMFITMLTSYYSGIEMDSSALVPGDVIDLGASQLNTVPADLFLLSGDAIVNESMLTGESVPVSKTAVSDTVLTAWRTSADAGREASGSFLYSGTRVVRIRAALATDGTPGSPALALVVRGGTWRDGSELTFIR
jgi:cation-transporting P-type ATPase 13A2